MTVAEAIERQEAEKKRLSRLITKGPRVKRRSITKADVASTVLNALAEVARDIRFKAKETPGWASAYHSACAVIEKKATEFK